MIRAVVFDVGGVLLRLGEWEYRREIARRMGFGPASSLASAPMLPAEYEENVPLLQRGELAEEVLWSRMAGRPVAADAFDDAWLANFPVDEAMVALAGELREVGLRTAILSNTQASHVRLMRGMGFLEGFGPVEVGFSTAFGSVLESPAVSKHLWNGCFSPWCPTAVSNLVTRSKEFSCLVTNNLFVQWTNYYVSALVVS